MAFRKTLANQLYGISKISHSSIPLTNHSIFSALAATSSNYANTTFCRDFMSESGEKGFFRRFLQKRAIVQSATSSSISSTLIGEKMMSKLKEMNVNRDRIRLEGLYPPHLEKKPEPPEDQISIEDAKKILRASQLEKLKSTLKQIPNSCISYEDFVRICSENSNPDQGLGFAKMLDDSGSVIVLGNVVYLHPEQVTRAIEDIIPRSILQPNDPRKKELEIMEKEKADIDREAESLVRRELWAGLGFLVVQTAGFVRLTFWELSWDVMEPICFYVTSVYFMAGYTFFLRTSKDPSFEGFFESRFSAKQKRLMKKRKFDFGRFNELKRVVHPFSLEQNSSKIHSFDTSDRNLISSIRH
ncbi:hypothetical protein ACHQM5_023237 [Ranunculus cassubicifolius]